MQESKYIGKKYNYHSNNCSNQLYWGSGKTPKHKPNQTKKNNQRKTKMNPETTNMISIS